MTTTAATAPTRPMQGDRVGLYALIVSAVFTLAYVVTRSPILIGDSGSYIEIARGGDAGEIHYGEPGHFLQVPMARGIWRALSASGFQVSLEHIFVAISLVGTLAAIVFLGLIAAEILRTETAAWIAAVLFGTSLNIWTQWNGELYGVALGFVTAGLFFALRGRTLIPACLWALSVLSHSEFFLAAPAFLVAVWMTQPDGAIITTGTQRFTRFVALLLAGGAFALVVLLLGGWLLGKWFDGASLSHWFARSYAGREGDISARPEVIRALKGLLTAYTVAGHYWRDILTGRGAFQTPRFLVAASLGLFVLVTTGVLVAVATVRQRRLALFALAWLLPFHVLLNWWFVPTVEKYHAGALPGFVLLVTGGLVYWGARLPPRGRYLFYGGYAVVCAGLNLFGAVLPMKVFGEDTVRAARDIRRFADERGGRAVFVACDDPKPVVEADVEFLRLRSVWTGTPVEIQHSLISWTRARLGEGKEPYVVGRWCLPEEWKTTWSKDPFDLFFLSGSFKMSPTPLTDIPIAQSVPTNPFNWTRGAVTRLEPN